MKLSGTRFLLLDGNLLSWTRLCQFGHSWFQLFQRSQFHDPSQQFSKGDRQAHTCLAPPQLLFFTTSFQVTITITTSPPLSLSLLSLFSYFFGCKGEKGSNPRPLGDIRAWVSVELQPHLLGVLFLYHRVIKQKVFIKFFRRTSKGYIRGSGVT